jgi:hypothetical protein
MLNSIIHDSVTDDMIGQLKDIVRDGKIVEKRIVNYGEKIPKRCKRCNLFLQYMLNKIDNGS